MFELLASQPGLLQLEVFAETLAHVGLRRALELRLADKEAELEARRDTKRDGGREAGGLKVAAGEASEEAGVAGTGERIIHGASTGEDGRPESRTTTDNGRPGSRASVTIAHYCEAYERWLCKLAKHAELQRWSEHDKLLQFELHLSSPAKRIRSATRGVNKLIWCSWQGFRGPAKACRTKIGSIASSETERG